MEAVERSSSDVTAVISSADIRLSSRPWAFAEMHAAAIEAHWRIRSAQQPGLFNGRVLLLDEWMIAAGVLRGTCLTTDYKSFLYWHDNHGPDRTVRNLFAVAALHTREGWLVLARMSVRHSNPGLVYPPCGLLHPEDDVAMGAVDLDGNMLREVREETGLVLARSGLGPRILVQDGPRTVYVRQVKLPYSAAETIERVSSYVAGEADPEIAELVFVKGRGDIVEHVMPRYAITYIEHVFADRTA